MPKLVVSYVVGLGIEFVIAQWKKEEIQEGFLVSGILIPMIVPVDCPLWILAVATAFAVIFAKEVFGGTGIVITSYSIHYTKLYELYFDWKCGDSDCSRCFVWMG